LVTLTSSAHTSASKRNPVRASTASMNPRSDPVTRARGSPAAATSASSSRAPGRSGTPWSRTRSVTPSMSQLAICPGVAGRVALAIR
jgi:hypothetical protein